MMNIFGIIAGFVEANYEDFQHFLEEEYEIEGTEAELILSKLKGECDDAA